MTPSPSATSPGNLVKYITHTDFYKALDEAAIKDIEAEKEAIKAWLDNKQAELDIVSSPSGQH